MASRQKGLFKPVPRRNDMDSSMYREIEKIAKDCVESTKERFKNENDIDLFLSNMKKKYPHIRIYHQLECELLGYGHYNKAMNQAIKRDNYTCRITGKKGNVVVHHLNSYNTHKELGCDLDNLISLDQDFHNLYHDITSICSIRKILKI